MTFAAEEAGEILSRDTQGRVLVSRERRELLLEQYDRSGMSGVKFAEYVGIKYSTLAYWRHDIDPYTYLRDVLSRLPTMTNRQIKV